MSVGQDEILYLIEKIDDEKTVPVDIFHHINSVYIDAVKGNFYNSARKQSIVDLCKITDELLNFQLNICHLNTSKLITYRRRTCTVCFSGTTVTELSVSLHSSPNFLDFKNHAGFLYIRPSFQCMQNVIRPSEPFLVGLLIHR